MHPRTKRLGLATTAIVALLALAAGPVAAGTGGVDGSFTQNGSSADVFSFDCASNGDGTTTCSGFNLSVFSGKMTDSLTGVTHTNQLCVYVDSATYDDETGEPVGTPLTEVGCDVDLPNGAIKFGSKLSSATLAPRLVSIQQMDCSDKGNCIPGPTRNVTVAGSWIGIGPITTSKYRSRNGDEFCREYDAGKGTNREAAFSGVIDGIAAGTNGFASLSDGKFSFRSRCVEV